MISHSFPVPVSRSLQVSLLASQPRSRLLGGSPVESLQSHMILTMSHWSSGLTCLHPVTSDPGSNPLGGYLCETGILLLALSRYNTNLNGQTFVLQVKRRNFRQLSRVCLNSSIVAREGLLKGTVSWDSLSLGFFFHQIIFPGFFIVSNFDTLFVWFTIFVFLFSRG